ncbi:hypothetical protein NX059_011402 [Plenodomus lindquistii]|nr:hypothetical protein NX059_011402 [Plenodomus lindquistii]
MSELGVSGPKPRDRLDLEGDFYNPVGNGAQFDVYHHKEASMVAKRVSLRTMSKANPDQLRVLELEIRALAHEPIYLHQNIVDLLDWGYSTIQDPSLQVKYGLTLPLLVPVLYVEPADEGSLDRFLHAAVRDWKTRANICLDIAAGLECLRKCGILHNDLKTENVLVFGYGEGASRSYIAKLADFGWAVNSGNASQLLAFSDYGATDSWKPPESVDFDFYQHGEFSQERLFKSESYVYGMLALNVLFTTYDEPSSMPFERENILRHEQISERFHNTELQVHDSVAEKAWKAIEDNFLSEDPSRRRDIEPHNVEFGDEIYQGWIFSRDAAPNSRGMEQKKPRVPLINKGWRFFQKMGPELLSQLQQDMPKNQDEYDGDLLFGMALSAASSPRVGFRTHVKSLLRQAALARHPSLRAIGVLTNVEAALKDADSEAETMNHDTAVLEAAKSGSITALSQLRASNPEGVGHIAREFRLNGGYNLESVLTRSIPRVRVVRMINLAATDGNPGIPNDLESELERAGLQRGSSTLLHMAAIFGANEAIRRLVQDLGWDIDAHNAEGETALYKACKSGLYETFELLSDLGAKSSMAIGRLRTTCLHWLFAFDPPDMEKAAKVLLTSLTGDECASPVIAHGGEWVWNHEEMTHYPFHWPSGSPIHWAAHMDNTQSIDCLVKLGAEVDILDTIVEIETSNKKDQAQTPLSMAMYRASPTVVKLLLSKGADPNKSDIKGRTPLHMLSGDFWTQNRLFALPRNLDQWSYHGTYQSCVENMKMCIEAVKSEGTSLNPHNLDGLTPLMEAVLCKNVAAVVALLELGADANICRDRMRRLPLHHWLTVNPTTLVYPEAYFIALDKLLLATTDINHPDETAASLVLYNYSSYWKQKLKNLLDHPAHTIDLNQRSGHQPTILSMWVEFAVVGIDYIDGIKWLQEKGADLLAKDDRGRNLLFYAAGNQDMGDETFLAIWNYCVESESSPSPHSLLMDSKCLKTGKTAFMRICQNGWIKSVNFALSGDTFDVDACTHDGQTSLDLTLEAGNKVRLALLSAYHLRHNNLPRRDDTINDEIFYRSVFGESTTMSESKLQSIEAAKLRYEALPAVTTALISAKAHTGKQLGRRKYAPDIKLSETYMLEELGEQSYPMAQQPFYDLWSQSYPFDDD